MLCIIYKELAPIDFVLNTCKMFALLQAASDKQQYTIFIFLAGALPWTPLMTLSGAVFLQSFTLIV